MEGSSKRRLGLRCLSLACFSGADGDEDGAADGTDVTWSISGVDLEDASRTPCEVQVQLEL